MCVAPKVDTPAPPVPDDSIPAATALALGSVPRGAAGLGRLALRIGGTSSATKAAAPSVPSPPAASSASQDSSTSAAPQGDGTTTGVVPSGQRRVPNPNLTFSVGS